MNPDWFARGLGAASFLLGAIGTWIAVLVYRRERPKLKVTWRLDHPSQKLIVSVVNIGRQATAVTRVSLHGCASSLDDYYAKRLRRRLMPRRWRWRVLEYPDNIGVVGNLEDSSVSLQPGLATRVSFSFDQTRNLFEEPEARFVYAHAEDAHGGVAYSEIPADFGEWSTRTYTVKRTWAPRRPMTGG